MTDNATTTIAPLTDALQALDDFQRAFVLRGARAQFNRAAKLLLPFLGQIPYEFLLEPCDCADLEVWYIRDEELGGGYFYSVCHMHRLTSLGRAVKCPRLGRDDSQRVHRRRKSGYSTVRWYRQRGL